MLTYGQLRPGLPCVLTVINKIYTVHVEVMCEISLVCLTREDSSWHNVILSGFDAGKAICYTFSLFLIADLHLEMLRLLTSLCQDGFKSKETPAAEFYNCGKNIHKAPGKLKSET